MDEILERASDPAAVTIGAATLTPFGWSGLWSVTPFRGRAAAVSAALGLPLGDGAVGPDGRRLIRAGMEQWFLEGPEPVLGDTAAVTDQSDGWLGLRLTGPAAAAVLARLVPVDLAMTSGAAVRTMLGHVMLLLVVRPDGFDLFVQRSFAETALEDLRTAMRGVAARAML